MRLRKWVISKIRRRRIKRVHITYWSDVNGGQKEIFTSPGRYFVQYRSTEDEKIIGYVQVVME